MARACVVSDTSTSGGPSTANSITSGTAKAGPTRRQRSLKKANQASATSPITSAQGVSSGSARRCVLQAATSPAISSMRSIDQPMASSSGASSPNGIASTARTAAGIMMKPTSGSVSRLPTTPSGEVCWKW